MALTSARNTDKKTGDPISARVGRGAAVDVLYKGGMAAVNAAGYLAPAGVAATDRVCGRFLDTYDNSGGSAGDISAEVEQGVFRWANGDSITAANIGSACYASDDQTVTKGDNAGNRPFAGVILDVDSVGVWVLQGLFLQASASGAQQQSANVPRLYAARGASTANVANLAAFTVANDGLTLVAGEVVLLKNQSAPAENGLYVVGTVGGGTAPLTRASWFDSGTEIAPGAVVHVSEGTVNVDRFYFLPTNAPITVGSTSLTFTRQPDLAQLAATTVGNGASLIGVYDVATQITATNVEDALAEIVDTSQALVVDLASTDPAKGAALVGYDGGTTVKAALDASITLQKRTVTIGEADLTEGGNGVAQVLNIGAVLPANAVVLAAEVDIATLFSGGGATSVKLDIGGTAATAIANQHDVFTGAATGALTPTPAGVHQRGKFSAEQLVATFTPSGGHSLLNLTAGSLTITVWFSVLA
jgi:hypothetical protein